MKNGKVKVNGNTNSTYDASAISSLSFKEAVRKKSSLYIGSKDSDGIFTILKEIIDNAVDESLNKFSDVVGVDINTKTDKITVFDRGRGIPIDIHKKTKKPAIISIFTEQHTGGKLDKTTTYTHGSVGSHGLGAKLTNFMSKIFEVYTFRDKWYSLKFENGELVGNLRPSQAPVINKKKHDKGTVISFVYDKSVFNKDAKLDTKKVREYLKNLSYFVSKVKFQLTIDGKQEVFKTTDGINDYINDVVAKYKLEKVGKPFVYSDEQMSIGLQWTDHTDEILLSYVNGVPTRDGGTHVKGLIDAINKLIEPFKSNKDFTPSDFRVGCVIIISVYVMHPEFESQVKHRLVTQSVQANVFKTVQSELGKFFAKNKSFVNQIIKRAQELRKLHAQFKLNQKATAELRNVKAKSMLPTKLATCTTKKAFERELTLVEGDSAAGSSKQARDVRFQEILSLKGKIVNAYGKANEKVFVNEEVLSIMRAIGFTGNDKKFDLRVGKIIILTDPDPDGRHISVLLLNLFHKVLPKTIVDSLVYIVDAPLFIYVHKQKKYFGNSLKEIKETLKLEKLDPTKITRLKGWGEINHDDLRTIAFDVNTRKLIKIVDLKKDEKGKFFEIVGENAAGRRILLGL